MKYVDDTTVWECCDREGEDSHIQEAAYQTDKWSKQNNMQLNYDKTKEMIIYFGKKSHSVQKISINGQKIERVPKFKLLGIIFNDKLTWHDHVEYICTKASRRLYFLRMLKRAGRSPSDICDVYTSTVRSVLEYASIVWHSALTKQQSDNIEHIQE